MGLDDLTDDKKEEAQSVDEEEVEEFETRFYQLEEVVVELTDKVNELTREVSSIQSRLEHMESDTETDDETYPDGWGE